MRQYRDQETVTGGTPAVNGQDGDPRRRLLFATLPAFGHLYPLMPLAFAARDAGHDVVFATAEDFVPRLRALGFQTHRAGISIDQAVQEALDGRPIPRTADGRPDWDAAGKIFLDVLAPRMVEDLRSLMERLPPDLVVYAQIEFGAAVAAALAGVPAICHSWGRAFGPEVAQKLGQARIGALWARYDRAPAPLDVFRGDAYLDICPPSLQEPSALQNPPRIPMRPVPWNEPGEGSPAWVGARSRPLVYLTLGTVPFRDGDALRAAAAGLSRLDVDVLVALGPHDHSVLGAVPAAVRVERFVHQAEVLRHVDLVVHHGGSGTTLGALSQGLPQLLLPQGADQFMNADALVAAGLGLCLEPDDVSPDAVATAARSLFADGSYRTAARSVRREIDSLPHPAEVLPALVSMTAPRGLAECGTAAVPQPTSTR